MWLWYDATLRGPRQIRCCTVVTRFGSRPASGNSWAAGPECNTKHQELTQDGRLWAAAGPPKSTSRNAGKAPPGEPPGRSRGQAPGPQETPGDLRHWPPGQAGGAGGERREPRGGDNAGTSRPPKTTEAGKRHWPLGPRETSGKHPRESAGAGDTGCREIFDTGHWDRQAMQAGPGRRAGALCGTLRKRD